MKDKRLLIDEEQDNCTPTAQEIADYLAEPDDAIAKCLSLTEKRQVAKAILYGRKIAQAQLAKAEPEIRKDQADLTKKEMVGKVERVKKGCPYKKTSDILELLGFNRAIRGVFEALKKGGE